MYRRLVLMLMVLILAACAPVAPTAVPASLETATFTPLETAAPAPLPTEQPSSPWDDPYEKVPADLCSRDKEPIGQPIFDAAVSEPYEGEQVTEVWVQHGLFANDQGELFRMDVIGFTKAAVESYTQGVKVCLDQIFTGEVTTVEPGEPALDQPSKEFGMNPEDISVEVYLVGFFDPAKLSGDEVIKKILELPAQQWADKLKEMELLPDQARPKEFEQDYVIDFMIDPTANNSGTHHYPERSGTKAWVNVSVAGGGGSVKGKLCRNGVSVDTTTVTKGGALESDTLSHNNWGIRATYDLGIKGNSNGTYRLSGRLGWSGWSVSYLSDAPVGSLQCCIP